MVNGISSSAASYAADRIPGTQASTAAPSTIRAVAPQADSVKLSPTAQARVMLHQGMPIDQIAAKLGLSVQAVSTSLGLTTTAAFVPVAAPQSSSAK